MACTSTFGKYTHAIVRAIPSSFGGGPEATVDGQKEGPDDIDLAKAHRQYGVYTGILRQKLGLQLIEIPVDEAFPESVFVEDIVVVQGDTALLTRPWAPNRRKETAALKKILEELKLRVVEMTDENATLDGSDVLFTGREFFVGISKRTNHRGAEIVADTFKTMGQLTDYHYDTLTVQNDAAANCLFVRVGQKNHLVHCTAEEYPDSVQVFQKLSDHTLLQAAFTEVAKKGGALTTCSLLINKKLDL
ncbi:N(G),N(G)-dimethylarginine dimethylaminohydrolase 2 isoform X2 [Protopterus annectens]|uniref:N(G),N(G)-dimethylarginine dimethylaminohydrolase 2 isoform X2 n=1 Tax=Protopterus annectens TaxID=7888 RepID=UPI001CF9D6EA|nr:N(G),N(G)-dimethylarginine dimethylaminohydrolase 2 isoform X2 [Protopterus annectens]